MQINVVLGMQTKKGLWKQKAASVRNFIYHFPLSCTYLPFTNLEFKDTVSEEEEVMRGNLERCSLARSPLHQNIKITRGRCHGMAIANSGGINAQGIPRSIRALSDFATTLGQGPSPIEI